jgi:hypothetical protein
MHTLNPITRCAMENPSPEGRGRGGVENFGRAPSTADLCTVFIPSKDARVCDAGYSTPGPSAA